MKAEREQISSSPVYCGMAQAQLAALLRMLQGGSNRAELAATATRFGANADDADHLVTAHGYSIEELFGAGAFTIISSKVSSCRFLTFILVWYGIFSRVAACNRAIICTSSLFANQYCSFSIF